MMPHIFHKWGKWEQGVATYEDGKREWEVLVQVRTCSVCWKRQIERLNPR